MKYKNLLTAVILMLFVFSVLPAGEFKTANNPTFTDLQGKKVTLRYNDAALTIVNFWATWCTPCLKEMPVMERVCQEYRNLKVKVVGIAVLSDTNKIQKMLQLTGVTYPVLISSSNEAKALLKNMIVPQTLIIDSHGKVLARLEGSQDYKTLKELVEKLLAVHTLSGNIK